MRLLDIRYRLSLVEGKRAGLNKLDEFRQGAFRILVQIAGVAKPDRMAFKLFKIDDAIGEIGLNQDVDVEIDVTQHVTIEDWWHVDIAIVAPQTSIRLTKAEDVVPAVEPIKFRADCPAGNRTEEIVFNVSIKFGVKHD